MQSTSSIAASAGPPSPRAALARKTAPARSQDFRPIGKLFRFDFVAEKAAPQTTKPHVLDHEFALWKRAFGYDAVVLWSHPRAMASDAFKELLLELAEERSLQDLLPLITRRLAEHEDVALARLWLLDPGDVCSACPNASVCADRTRCLHLVASAARTRNSTVAADTRLDGAFRRIPVGAFKVGAVAAGGVPVLVTDPEHDPKIRNPLWVKAEGIQGFAGLPLVRRGEMLGVLGVFVRTPITTEAVDVLRIVANHAGAAIATARAFAQVESMQRQLFLENERLRQKSADSDALEDMIGNSPVLRDVLQQIGSVASTDTTVLVLGESGTGKELVARAIHQRSRRGTGPFIEVNCAAIPRELCETELFGHVRGAFSGATRDRVGRFEAAAGGTLFLDEIGELPLELQGKLLRVLQEGTYERVGEVRTQRADVRVIAATNRNLKGEIDNGRFRRDLYYRLAVYPIALPPLRDRREDMAALAPHLLARICRRLRRPPLALTPEQLGALAERSWPGNVRELLNVLERAVISADGSGVLRLPPDENVGAARHLPVVLASAAAVVSVPALEGPPYSPPPSHADPQPVVPDLEMRRRERENLRRALELCSGRIYGHDGAAALLGLKPTTLASRLKRLHIRSSPQI
jgi:transcriptional regulator with GAF, ATPase, and Fis domain